MNFELATISEVRQDSLKPVKVVFLESEDSTDWVTVDMASWAVIKRADLGIGTRCLVLDAGLVDSSDRFFVTAIFPTPGTLALEDTTERLARENDMITGTVTLMAAKHLGATVVTQSLPPFTPLTPVGQANLDISLTIKQTDSDPTPQDGDA
jgi:hypothetical protein